MRYTIDPQTGEAGRLRSDNAALRTALTDLVAALEAASAGGRFGPPVGPALSQAKAALAVTVPTESNT